MVKIETLIMLCCIVLLAGCSSDAVEDIACTDDSCGVEFASVEKIEVFHFHGHSQCYSCKTVGAYAEETVNTYFSEELESGKIVFNSINAELEENRELAIKYGATGSSLWLGVYDDTGFHPEQNTQVWYKINNKDDYMNYLKGVIEKRLIGDYS